MGKIIEYEGYNFEVLPESNSYKPFKVKCLENGEIKDSSINHKSAMDLIITLIEASNSSLELQSKDKEYVENIFSTYLKNKKLKEANNIVETKIAGKRIYGKVTIVKSDIYSKERVYLTDKFKIVARAEYRPIGISEIIVEEI